MTFNALGTVYTRPGVHRQWHPSVQGTGSKSPEIALVVSKKAWNDITSSLTKTADLQEAQQRDQATKNYLKEGSYEMKKNWTNSVENMRKQRLQILEGKKAAALKEHNEYLSKALQQNSQEKEQFLDKMKKSLFYEYDDSKNLTSALVLSETLFEREKQMEFDRKIKEMTDNDDDKYKKHNEEENRKQMEEDKQNAQKRLEAALETQAFVLKQIEENARNADNKNQIEEEKKVLAEMQKRLQEIENEEAQEEMKKQQMTKCLLEQAKRQRKEFENRMQAEDEEDSRIIEAFNATKARINQILKENLKKTRQQKLKTIEEIGQNVFAQFKSNAAEEQRILEKCIAERNDALDAYNAAREAHQQQMAEEKRQAYFDYMEEKKRQLDEEDQLIKWELMNRLKNEEVFAAYLADQARKQAENKAAVKDALIKQREHDRKTRMDAEERFQNDYREELNRLKAADDRFLQYATEVIEESRKNGRSTLPLERVLNEFKIKNGYMESTMTKLYRPKKTGQKPGQRTTPPMDDPTIAIKGETVKRASLKTIKGIQR